MQPYLLFSLQGTRDFYPEDHLLRTWLFNHWRASALTHGFEEYDAPVVENEELYLRKGGEEMSQQLYNFNDKGGRRICLRPEMTPSLARMILAKGSRLHLPLKWFSIPQCWRYERMAKGRRRFPLFLIFPLSFLSVFGVQGALSMEHGHLGRAEHRS
jgi:histidyl-tRNA synthetase